MNHRLQAYVSEECYGCGEARGIAEEIAARFPDLDVEIIDLDKAGAEHPSAVFAVPTYLFDGELLWLGNPYREDAVRLIADILEQDQEA